MHTTHSILTATKGKSSHISFLTLLSALVLCIVVIGCGDSSTNPRVGTGNGNTSGNGNEEPAPDEVWMVGQSFSPGDREVEVGTSVTWINRSNLVHTVTSGTDGTPDGTFDSGELSAGESFSHQFNEAGTFDYYCIPHVNAGMTGTITVTDEDDG